MTSLPRRCAWNERSEDAFQAQAAVGRQQRGVVREADVALVEGAVGLEVAGEIVNAASWMKAAVASARRRSSATSSSVAEATVTSATPSSITRRASVARASASASSGTTW